MVTKEQILTDPRITEKYNFAIERAHKSAALEQYTDILTNTSASILDIIEDVLIDKNIIIYNVKDKEEITDIENSLGFFGDVYYDIESKVEDTLEDFTTELHDNNLIQGIIFDEDEIEE